MLKQTITTDSHTDHFLTCDAPEFAKACEDIPKEYKRGSNTKDKEFYGDKTFNQCLECVKHGDLSQVQASDKLMAELEVLVPMSKGFAVRDDFVGALPNIPAMLAGNPCHMRRRVRTASNIAPLSVFVDLPAQANITAETMRKRGTAMLALVRLLANTRPVELWAACPIGGEYPFSKPYRATVFIRIDTAPLDLARAAHILTHASVSRALCFSLLNDMFLDHTWCGHYPLDNLAKHKANAVETYRQVVHPGNEVLYIPPAHSQDECLNEPTKWLVSMLHKHGNAELAAA